jgi:hypothetical protein
MSIDTATIRRIISLSTGLGFAVLEEKNVLSSVLRKFELELLDNRENIDVLYELMLRPKYGLRIKIHQDRTDIYFQLKCSHRTHIRKTFLRDGG